MIISFISVNKSSLSFIEMKRSYFVTFFNQIIFLCNTKNNHHFLSQAYQALSPKQTAKQPAMKENIRI